MVYTKSEVIQYVEENDVKFIKLFFTDILGAEKSLTVQPSVLKKALSDGISFDGSSVKGFLGVEKSDLFLFPDPTTLRVLPWRPQHGRVARLYCNICYRDGTPFERDTRRILENVLKGACEDGYDVQIGTECEFYLFRFNEHQVPTDEPLDYAGYCDLAPFDKGENVRRDIILTLEQMGIEPLTSHHETGPGQNEIGFKYTSAMTSADNFTTFKTIVKTIAHKDGLYASFMPKPLPDEAGSGLHINISILKNGQNLFREKNPEADSFVAGIMKYIRDFTVFLNPTENSFRRLGRFEAPKYIAWGRENRSLLVRIPAADEDSVRMELRSPDAKCNQYLAFAFIIAAGLRGIKENLVLPEECRGNLFDPQNPERNNLQQLPSSLDEACELAKKSEFVRNIMDQESVEACLSAFKAYSDRHTKPLQHPRYGSINTEVFEEI